MFLMKLNANGDTIWTKHYGTCNSDVPRELVKAPGNGYYLSGSINFGSSSFGNSLLRLNAQGDTLWTRLFDVGGYDKQQNYSCTATLDGGVLISGFIYDTITSPYSSYLIKIDSNGIIQWHNYIDSPLHNDSYNSYPISTGYILIGMCNFSEDMSRPERVQKSSP